MENAEIINVELRDSSSTSSGTSAKTEIIAPRRRWSAQQKMELVKETYLPGKNVSIVAREHGVSPSLLFKWRALDRSGSLASISDNAEAVPASKYAEALDEIKRLQQLLGKATQKNAILEEFVEICKTKKWLAR